MGGGSRAAVLDTTSLSAATNSKNAEVAAIRVTSELARSEDPFVRCAGCGVGQGRGAPVQARASRNQLPTEKTHMIWKTCFRVFAGRSQTPYIYNELSPSRRSHFLNFYSQLANSTSGPRGASGIQSGPNLNQSGSNLNQIGQIWDPMGPNIYSKTPDQPPKRTLCYYPHPHPIPQKMWLSRNGLELI